MQLSQLLHYQLYDCQRDRVLLQSEIRFMEHLLRIEKLKNEKFNYEIVTSGNLNSLFIPPLLFLPAIQNPLEHATLVRLSFLYTPNTLEFECHTIPAIPFPATLYNSLKKNLDLQYPGRNDLVCHAGKIQIQISLLPQ